VAFSASSVELGGDVVQDAGAVEGQVGALGMYWRSSPLMFSLVPRCQGC
jgi:hypothetical protein